MQWPSNGAASKCGSRRSEESSRKLWAIASDIAKSGKEWGGIKLSKGN